MSDEDDSSEIGPALPPGFLKEGKASHDNPPSHALSSPSSGTPPGRTKSQTVAGPIIGPVLPPGLSSASQNSESEDSDSDSSSSSDEEPTQKRSKDISNEASASSSSIGPALPPGFVMPAQQHSSDEDGDLGIGPRPVMEGAEKESEEEYVRRLMRHRLQQQADSSDVPHRESWMTQLPEVKLAKHMGLQARKLGDGSKVKYEDQSAWTDTPADRARKQQEALEGVVSTKRKHNPEEEPRSARDVELEGLVKQYNKKKRAESLLDMHTKKIHKKHKKEEKKRKKEKKKKDKKNKKDKSKSMDEPKRPERRPFDRDLDLKANRFDAAQRQALVKRSKELNSKFKAGVQHFL